MHGTYELVIGDKNTSSWSLRPWLVMKVFGIPFSETLIRLRRPKTLAEILRHSPAAKVPVLKSDGLLVWDTLAIIEFLAEQHPNKAIWPADASARAVARSASAEMHSSFQALRNECPMDFVNMPGFPDASAQTLADIARVVEIWKDCHRRFAGGGAFLFGGFSAADAMFAPVASRFRSYDVDLSRFGDDGTAARYRDTMMSMPEMRAWADDAKTQM